MQGVHCIAEYPCHVYRYIQSSSLVTDTVLESLSTNLDQLDHLLIAGCPKVSHEGVGALVCRNRNGLLTLNLEGLSQSFVRSAMSRYFS